MKFYKYLLIFSLAVSTIACEKDEDLGTSNINTTFEKNEIDQWIYTNLTKPYNVEVKYKFDDSELESDKVLTPPSMDQVIPFLTMLKETWISTYERAGGSDFIKRMVPKQIVLVGSKNMNTDGTITQGTAEGGRKVVLYQINEFSLSNQKFMKRLLHVMHHEFGHILHQETLYPEEYKLITPGGYTSSWMNVKLPQALNEGFISPYSKNIVDDDWVEIIAHILTNSREDYDALVEKAEQPGRDILRVKEKYVSTYFESVWNIDIYALQTDINEVLTSYKK